MTDNEIIKALECCKEAKLNQDCLDLKCPFATEYGCNIDKEDLRNEALDLINRQKAEIESLEKKARLKNAEVIHYKSLYENNNSETTKSLASVIKDKTAELERYKGVIKILENDVKTAKSEAIKEFAERVKDRIAQHRATIVFERKLVNSVLELAVSTMEVALKEMTE